MTSYFAVNGTVGADWICMRVDCWTSTAIGFLFFIFDLEYLIKVHSFEPLQAKLNPTSCLFGSRIACAQTMIFSAESWSKKTGETSVVLWITAHEQRIPTSRNPNQNRAALWWIFSSNKSVPGRQDSMQTVIQTSRRLDSFLHEAAQNFEVFSYIQERD